MKRNAGHTKQQCYQSCFTLLRHTPCIKRLEAVQQRHLQRILRIKYSDYVSNVEVLRIEGMSSVEAVLDGTQLEWTGHIARMGEDCIHKILL